MITSSDWAHVDTMIGEALLYEDICLALLNKKSRKEYLESQCEHLSQAACEFLMSIDDKDKLEALAFEIYTFQSGNGLNTVH